jgi:hypothetical protein
VAGYSIAEASEALVATDASGVNGIFILNRDVSEMISI